MAHLTIENNSLKPNDEMIERINEFCKNQFTTNDPISLKDGLIEFDDDSIKPEKLKTFLENRCGKKEAEVLNKNVTLRRKNTVRRQTKLREKKKELHEQVAKRAPAPPQPPKNNGSEPKPKPKPNIKNNNKNNNENNNVENQDEESTPEPEPKEECRDVFDKEIPYYPKAEDLILAIHYNNNKKLEEYDDLDNLDNVPKKITPLTSKVLVDLIEEQAGSTVSEDINKKYNYILDLELDKPLIDLRDLADIDKTNLFNVLCNKTLLSDDGNVDRYLDYDVSSFELKLKEKDERGKKGGAIPNEQEVALGAIGDRSKRLNLRTSLRAVLEKYITFIDAKNYKDLYIFIQKFKNFFTEYQSNSNSRLKFENIKLEPLKKSEKSDARNIFTPTFFKEITKNGDENILGGIEFLDNILKLKDIPKNLTGEYKRLRKHIQFNDLIDILINQEKTADNTKANHVILNDIIKSIDTYTDLKAKIEELFEKKSTKFNKDYLKNFKTLIDNLFLNFKQISGDAYKNADNFVSMFRQINIAMEEIDKYNRFICMKTKDILEIQFFLCIFGIEKFKELRNNKYLKSFDISKSDDIGIVVDSVNKSDIDCDILTELHEIKLFLINISPKQGGGFDFKKQIKQTIKKNYPLTLNKNILVGGSDNASHKNSFVSNIKSSTLDESQANNTTLNNGSKTTQFSNTSSDTSLDPPKNKISDLNTPSDTGSSQQKFLNLTSVESTSDLNQVIKEVKNNIIDPLQNNITYEQISENNKKILEKIVNLITKIKESNTQEIPNLLKDPKAENITKIFELLKEAKDITNDTDENITQENKTNLQDKLNKINDLLTPGETSTTAGGAKKKNRKRKKTKKRKVKKVKK